MLRFDKAMLFSSLLKYILSVRLSISTWGLEVYIDMIMLLYIFLIISFDSYKE